MKPLYHCAACGRLSTFLPSYKFISGKFYCDSEECRVKLNKEQTEWLQTYDRKTWSLSTHNCKCGYGDLLRQGFVVNRRTMEMPDLFITLSGLTALSGNRE